MITLSIENRGYELEISDIDKDDEVYFETTDRNGDCTSILLTRDDLIEIRKHLDYLINKLQQDEHKARSKRQVKT